MANRQVQPVSDNGKSGLGGTSKRERYLLPFILIISLFFLWGFAISMLDVLNKHFQEVLDVSKAQSGFIQLVVYGAYFLMALPAGYIIRKAGYKRGIISGLLLYASGSFLFYPAAYIQTFQFFLLCLFVIGCGLAIIETAANPYITVLGDPQKAAQRLNLAQSFNGLGVILGPLVGGLLIFTETNEATDDLSSIQMPYISIGLAVLVVALLFSVVKLPEVKEPEDILHMKGNRPVQLLEKKYFVYGVIAQFFYVGVQAGIWGFFINYATEEIQGMTNQTAAFYLSGAMVLYTAGRFTSTWLMRYILPEQLLVAYALLAALATGVVISNMGMLSVYAVILICFCMSIMFPTIFALGVRDLGSQTKKGASFMIMAIVGGAVIPPVMGFLADTFDTATSFYLPAICFLIIGLYAWKGYKA